MFRIVLILFFLYSLTIFNLNIFQYSYFFNSDSLYIPDLFNSIFKSNHNITGWRLPPAPYFFPDVFLYSIFTFFTHSNPEISIYIYANAQIFIMGCLLYYFSKRLGILNSFIPVICLMILLLNLSKYIFPFILLWTIPGIHGGQFLVSLFMLTVSRPIPKKYFLLSIIFLLNLIIGISDKLYFPVFILPFSITLLLSQENKKKSIYYLLGCIILPFFSGIFIFSTLPFFTPDHYYPSVESINQWMQLKKDFQSTNGLSYLYLNLVLVSLVGIGFLTIKNFISLLFFIRMKYSFYIHFFFLQAIILAHTIFSFYLYINLETLKRYFMPILFIPFLVFLIIYSNKKTFRKNLIISLLSLSIFLSFAQKNSAKSWEYYPDYIRCLDKLSLKYNLKNGLSGYWDARPVHFFSKSGLLVLPINDKMMPKHWINNIYSYKDISFQFIYLKNSLSEKVIQKFGIPDKIESCSAKKVFIYKRGFKLNYKNCILSMTPICN